jgi:FkbM family methyltransferase
MKLEKTTSKLVNVDGNPTQIFYRPGTKDENVIKEVLEQRCYRNKRIGFDVEEGENWLDLGAHIGCFSIYCFALGAEARAYEPQVSNFQVLRQNVGPAARMAAVSSSPAPKVSLYATPSGHSTKFNILGSARGVLLGETVNYQFSKILEDCNGIKMDIEGAEHGIIDNLKSLPKSVKKLVMEYHFTKDSKFSNFVRRMKILRKIFTDVHYPAHLQRMIDEGVEDFPGHFDRFVYCQR